MFDDTRAAATSTESDIAGPALVRSGLIARQDALEHGFTADEIKRKVARREWIVIRPGRYLQASALPSLDAAQRHRVHIDAGLPRAGEGAVVSHLSAACEHGIELIRAPVAMVQVTNPAARTGHRRPLLQTYRAGLDDDEWVLLRGHRVTSVARTIVDIARSRPFEEGVVAADSALHQGLVSRVELMVALKRDPQRAGMRRARRVAMFADAAAESVGESRSRLLLAHERLPTPVTQFPVRGRAGDTVAVSDFGWEEFGTVGEFDGAQKYGRLLKPGERPGDRIFQEKIREDRIRDTGLQVVRWTWDDLDHPADLAARIRRTLERGLSARESALRNADRRGAPACGSNAEPGAPER